jgi:dTDP-4-amino-4,6-dideoxygalactose transaminase
MKSLRSASDLAINGAPPAFREYLHVGSPNVGSRKVFDRYIDEIFERNCLTNNGPLVQELESRIAKYHNVGNCVAMANGTLALEIAIRALGLKGEVIIPSFTFIATAHALNWQGITPVFADIDSQTHNLDPGAVRRMITSRTTGIIGVHLWGRICSNRELEKIARDYGLKLMFDAAHAFGCSSGGTRVGSFGECEIMSFHATKIFNTFEGGAILTNNNDLAEKLRLMRNFGFSGMDSVIYPGTNGKMTEVAAAMGLVNMDSLGKTLEKNRNNYYQYKSGLASVPTVALHDIEGTQEANYQYVVVEVDADGPLSRNRLLEILHAENVRARRYFWPGCHQMKPYSELFPNAGLMLPNTLKVAASVIILPTGTAVSHSNIEAICNIIKLAIEVAD